MTASKPTISPDAIYEILVEECGAAPANQWQSSFVDWFEKGSDPDEWRFSGWLGFGGKFWHNRGKLYVNCYREDETPDRLDMIERANARINAL